jgi:hypothetical protein
MLVDSRPSQRSTVVYTQNVGSCPVGRKLRGSSEWGLAPGVGSAQGPGQEPLNFHSGRPSPSDWLSSDKASHPGAS